MHSAGPLRHLYLHVPFCAKVCPYCAFHVHRGGREYQRSFVTALQQEIRSVADRYPWALETIYCGGGTPSLLETDWLREIMATVPSGAAEVTLEVNPITVTAARALVWREAGFNRISLGAQSFDPAFLKILGRDHTPDDIRRSFEWLRAAGFTNISLDLMFALPGQPRQVWSETLALALECRPDHVSCYGLTYEEDTPFFAQLERGVWRQNEEDEIWMFSETDRALEEAGLPFYEISNFARPGFESRHNRAYWQGQDYLGCGPSAYSTVGGQRWQTIRDTQAYIRAVESGAGLRTQEEVITPAIWRRERIMLGLRVREGLDLDSLGIPPDAIEALVAGNLAVVTNNRLQLTLPGRLVADEIAGQLLRGGREARGERRGAESDGEGRGSN